MIYPLINYSTLEEVKKEVERLSFLHSYKTLEEILKAMHEEKCIPILAISDNQNNSRFSYELDKEVMNLNVICDYDKDTLKELTIHFYDLARSCGTYHAYFLQNGVTKVTIDDAKKHVLTEEYYINEKFMASKVYSYSSYDNKQLIGKQYRHGNEIYERNYSKGTDSCTQLVNGKPYLILPTLYSSHNQFEKRHKGMYKRIRKLGYGHTK